MTTLLAVLLVVSVALNAYLWHRLRYCGGVPQEALDQIASLSAQLDEATAKLNAARAANTPNP